MSTRPFLKWAGGKHRQVPTFRALFPSGRQWRRLVEPFCGACSVALGLDYPRYLLTDSNPHLVNCLRHAQVDPEALHALSLAYYLEGSDRAGYLAQRDRFNRGGTRPEQAVLFLYLNRHAFNGLWRVNRQGHYNVAFGNYKRPYLPEAELQAFAERFTPDLATFRCSDFRRTLRECGEGDVVYCDPPYLTASDRESFTAYTADGFTRADHEDLVRLATEASERGAWVAVSNHHTPAALALYPEPWERHALSATHSISCDGATRGRVPELLAILAPKSADSRLTSAKGRRNIAVTQYGRAEAQNGAPVEAR